MLAVLLLLSFLLLLAFLLFLSKRLLLEILLLLAFLASFPADPGVPILAVGFVEWEVLHYRNTAFGLYCFAIELSEYRISYWRIQETIRLSDQGLNLSDYRISDSEKTIGCPPLLKSQFIPRQTLAGCRRAASLSRKWRRRTAVFTSARSPTALGGRSGPQLPSP